MSTDKNRDVFRVRFNYFSLQIIKEKREALRPADDNNNGNDNNNDGTVKNLNLVNFETKTKAIDSNIPTRKIFIDHVICNETKFSDLEIRDHVYTVVAAVSILPPLKNSFSALYSTQIPGNFMPHLSLSILPTTK